MSVCIDCQPGSYSSTKAGANCSQCSPGFFADRRKSTSCDPCPAGSYADDNGEVSCTLCPIGTYANSTGTATCAVCENSINTDVGQTECEPCDKGTRPNSDKSECEPYNIARDKPASQSTTYNSNGTPDHGTDGNTNGDYLYRTCTHTTSQRNPWWKVDLQDTFPVREVIVYNRADCCADRIDGFIIHVGNTGSSSDPVCGDALKSADFISSAKHVKCRQTGRYISIHHPSTTVNQLLTICELKAYTVELKRPCPTGYYSETGLRPCKPCRAGSYLDNGACKICPRGTFSKQDKSSECLACPAGHTTYKPDTSTCYGPLLQGNYYGSWLKRYVQIPDLGYVKDRLNGWVATLGDWELFDRDYYRVKKGTVKHGQTIGYSTPTVNSIKPIITNKFCYAPRDLGKSYTGYRSKTLSGKTCQNWSLQHPHKHTLGSVGNHNYCRNPDNMPEGPWCYTTDPATRWEYCDIPKCSQDVDCYLEEGQSYMGTVSTTEDGRTCDNWSGTTQNYCKNTANSGMHKPWCYKGGQKKACAVDKCEQDCGNPASGLWGRFVAKNSGLCVDVAGCPHTSIGDNVQLHNCQVPHKSTTDHVFKMDQNGYIINKGTNMCINVLGYKSRQPNTNLNMWTCQFDMNTDQKWEVQWSSFDDCAFRLKNMDTYQCIDAPGNALHQPGINLQQNPCQS